MFLREQFGYEPQNSRSWRLITQYSLTSASQADMFSRIRKASDSDADIYGLGEDWTASVEQIMRAVKEQALVCGLAGISEGATVASALLV